MTNETLNKQIGRNLQRLRKDAGYRSAKSFAQEIAISAYVYQDWEQGRTPIPFSWGWIIADKLNITIDELAGRSFPAPSYEDPRQEALNKSFESLNDTSKSEISGMVASIATDPSRLADAQQGD